MSDLPHSEEAEASVVGQILAMPGIANRVVGEILEPRHFYIAAFRVLFQEIETSHIADSPIDPLVIGEACSKRLAKVWACSEQDAVKKVEELAKGQQRAALSMCVNHAHVVKKHADYRALLDVAATIQREVAEEAQTPEQIAGTTSQLAMQIATDSILTHEIIDFGDLGRRYIKSLKYLKAARDQGVELGAYFGLNFIDNYTRGLKPTELLIAAGIPGVGKSAVWWRAGQNFAMRQMRKPDDQRLGVLVLSLEMGEEPSSARFGQTLARIDGGRLREGSVSDAEIAKLTHEWGKLKDLPLYINHTSTLKSSQMKALISESIRRHNVGVVIIDHFKYFDMDRRHDNPVTEDDEKVRFLKEDLAKDLNIAVICLAHTTKSVETADKRPRLSHLRGSQMIAAHADFVAMVHRPYQVASQTAVDQGIVSTTDAELIWEKNRHGLQGIAEFYADMTVMDIAEKL